MSEPVARLTLQDLLDAAGDQSPAEAVIKVGDLSVVGGYWYPGEVTLEPEATLVLR